MIDGRPDSRLNASACRQPARTRWWRQIHLSEEVPVRTSKKFAVVASTVAVVGAGGAGIATASGGAESTEGPDVPISGAALQRASESALAETGGGRVTGSEIDDEESWYEVEVTLGNGDQVDVQLDADFTVVGSATDSGD
jgi:hypothetical protein